MLSCSPPSIAPYRLPCPLPSLAGVRALYANLFRWQKGTPDEELVADAIVQQTAKVSCSCHPEGKDKGRSWVRIVCLQ